MTKRPGGFSELPENVRPGCCPKPDLTAVKIDPTNGCYVLPAIARPVETTFCPGVPKMAVDLYPHDRSSSGRLIAPSIVT